MKSPEVWIWDGSVCLGLADWGLPGVLTGVLAGRGAPHLVVRSGQLEEWQEQCADGCLRYKLRHKVMDRLHLEPGTHIDQGSRVAAKMERYVTDNGNPLVQPSLNLVELLNRVDAEEKGRPCAQWRRASCRTAITENAEPVN